MNIDVYNFSAETVFKITGRKEAAGILRQQLYEPESLKTDGFVHLSEKDQVAWVLQTFYPQTDEYVVFAIDKTRLGPNLKYDKIDGSGLPANRVFPHLYGPFPTAAVTAILEAADFLPLPDDTYVSTLIRNYQFKRLPAEGTFYHETYRSDVMYKGTASCGTAMIGLYSHAPLSFSCFHRLRYDEIWHFYGGDPLRLVLLFEDGSSKDVLLGADYTQGQLVQYTVPAGTWQAGEVMRGGRYTLYGCTVIPGFVPEIFEPADNFSLKKKYPDRIIDILRFSIGS
ncbi:MAG: cupin domain-containing protein [Treponema sp.]|jgi:predicted cupin superfamily sugar epimerase/uncharacterized protein (DUF952 family)|nr:cupin domain-containing protein [Treponema sp.]